MPPPYLNCNCGSLNKRRNTVNTPLRETLQIYSWMCVIQQTETKQNVSKSRL